ncbi:MAG: ABC transporter permease subunit [Dehalococcoidia bacterium]|nr:MAG: ABC transporter permease subunit [Dehalococcoidia bacterium]
MSGLGAFIKKEIKEQIKTYRFLIIAVVLLVIGLATPLMLKYLPQIIKLAGEDIVIDIPLPTAVQALTEYADTIIQVGVLMVVLIAMGSISGEIYKGTAAMVLSKPVSRVSFILAKLFTLSTSFTAALILASAACYGYTTLLLGEANLAAFLALNGLLILFFMVAISLTLLLSSVFRNHLAAGGLALVILIGQAVMLNIPRLGDYMPAGLVSWGTGLLSGEEASAWGALRISLAIIVTCLYLTWLRIRNKEL